MARPRKLRITQDVNARGEGGPWTRWRIGNLPPEIVKQILAAGWKDKDELVATVRQGRLILRQKGPDDTAEE